MSNIFVRDYNKYRIYLKINKIDRQFFKTSFDEKKVFEGLDDIANVI